MAASKVREIWFTTTKNGQRRAWYFSNRAFRTFAMSVAEADRMILAGEAIPSEKPSWV